MLIIHIDTMFDTQRLTKVYDGLDCTVLYNPQSRNEVVEAIEKETDTVVFLGHGSSQGLLSTQLTNFIFDSSMVSLLDGKDCVAIWCDASDFAEQYGAKGFFTDMFISNEYEAKMFGYAASNEEVLSEVDHFSLKVNSLLKEGRPLSEWVDAIRETGHLEKDFVKFNYDGLRYFE